MIPVTYTSTMYKQDTVQGAIQLLWSEYGVFYCSMFNLTEAKKTGISADEKPPPKQPGGFSAAALFI